jgi:hypothetical protein
MSTTRRSLVRRTVLLLTLTALTVSLLFAAYDGVHHKAEPLSSRTAPAILEVAGAQTALWEANEAAQAALEDGEPELTGTGYLVYVAAANQSLATAAEAGVSGEQRRRTLQTVTGLIVAYTSWVEHAYRAADEPALRAAYLYYADSMLTGPESGIFAWLDDFQDGQRETLVKQATFEPAQRWQWGAALLLGVVLVGLLVESQLVLRRRFRRRHNPWLLGATVALVLALAMLVTFTAQTHTAMDQAHDHLVRSVQTWEDSAQNPAVGTEDVSESIREAGQGVSSAMRGTGWRADLTVWVLVFGLLLAALMVRGVQPRLDEYRFEAQ